MIDLLLSKEEVKGVHNEVADAGALKADCEERIDRRQRHGQKNVELTAKTESKSPTPMMPTSRSSQRNSVALAFRLSGYRYKKITSKSFGAAFRQPHGFLSYSMFALSSACWISPSTNSRWLSFLPVRSVSLSR